VAVLGDNASFQASEVQATDQLLWREQLRGYECHESTSSPGCFVIELRAGSPVTFVTTTESLDSIAQDPSQTFLAEQLRASTLVDNAAAQADPFLSRLVAAADQFLILPESRPEEATDAKRDGHRLRTVVAGYYWFLDWGRDTMISLEGLMLATGRFSEARATLMTFSHYVRDGLLPNLFPEGSREGWYWTVDATLWYFHAIHRYATASGDKSLVQDLLPTLRDIMEHHFHGTLFNIHVDPADGLLIAGAPDHALTWMDAHMGDWIVTPRRGKPVEIQALWYNALCLMRDWETDGVFRAHYAECATRARTSFNKRFWNESRHCLFDVVDGEQGDDHRLRPNQIFPISLDHPVLDGLRWAPVVEAVQNALLTPVGLRTLESTDPDYRKNYQGDLRSRDAAYHQGTVWPWLIGPFIEAWLKVHHDRTRARSFLEVFPTHLDGAGLGSISEIFDADPPHAPHGCIAQAWSVAEVLRAWKLTA
jgi:predicted glycogen debranching enzyme